MVCVARLHPFSAAKEYLLEKISVTSDSGEEGPPYEPDPQLTTVPLLFRAAKALPSEKISITPELKLEATEELSAPMIGLLQLLRVMVVWSLGGVAIMEQIVLQSPLV